MAQETIYPQGTAIFDVPATQSVAISNFGGGIAKIYYLIDVSNQPNRYRFQQTLNNTSITLGPFSNGKTIKIESGNSRVFYDAGSSPDTGIGDADTLNGLASDSSDTASTIAARDSNADITANAFESTQTTGTAPLTVTSITVVPNLNADQADGYDASETSTVSTLAARDASANLTANVLISDVAGGTAPLTVTSTTKVTNLNADLLNGQTGSYYATDSAVVHLAGAEIISGEKTLSSRLILNNQKYLESKSLSSNVYAILGIDGTNHVDLGNASLQLDLISNGTLTYNGTTLASGTIDTTAAQTITVVDGLITAIA
jgi:hypothetical protein